MTHDELLHRVQAWQGTLQAVQRDMERTRVESDNAVHRALMNKLIRETTAVQSTLVGVQTYIEDRMPNVTTTGGEEELTNRPSTE